MEKLTKLPRTQISGLDFNNIITDVYTLIQENPVYNNNWDDFLSSNAGRMFLELYAYIADQLSTRVDWYGNENFISTATQTKSKINLLKQIGYKISLPQSATVNVSFELEKQTNKKIILTQKYEELSFVRNGIFSIQARDKNGEVKNFELLRVNKFTGKFDYKNEVAINADASVESAFYNFDFFEGYTKVRTFFSLSNENTTFKLEDDSIVDNSISVFRIKEGSDGQIEEELLQVSNFLDLRSFNTSYPITYVVNTTDEGKAEIEFAPSSILQDERRRYQAGSTIVVFYRTGGGLNGNIQRRSINQRVTLKTIDDEDIRATLINYFEGYNGTDAETMDHAVTYGPLSIQTVEKTVTSDDYNTILSRRGDVLKSISYGSNNMPTNFYEKYGYYINPQEVISFVVLNKNYENIPPSKYNYFNWLNLKYENRFNEFYSFNSGEFNKEALFNIEPITEDTLILNDVPQKLNNFFPIYISDGFKNSLYVEDEFGISVKNTQFSCKFSKSLTDKLFLSEITNLFISGDNSNTGLGYVGGQWEYTDTETCNADWISPVGVPDISEIATFGFDISNKHSIGLNIDGRGLIIISLKDDYTPTDTKKIFLSNPIPQVKPISYDSRYEARYHFGIVEKINNALTGSPGDINNLYGATARPLQYLGIEANSENAVVASLVDVNTPITFTIKINGVEYSIDYNEPGRTSKYYKDIATYINQDLNAAGFNCKWKLTKKMTYDLCFYPTDYTDPLVVEAGTTNDLLSVLYDLPVYDLPAVIPGGDYSNIASVHSFGGKSYLKITSPSTGESSTVLFIASDFSNSDVGTSYEFMDTLGVKFFGNTSGLCKGFKKITLVTNPESKYFGFIVYEHNSISYTPYLNKTLYAHYLANKKDKISLGEKFDNFYLTGTAEDELFKNKIHSVYNTVFEGEIPSINKSNFEIRFTKNKFFTNSILSFDLNEDDKVDIYPVDILSITTKHLVDFVDNTYFTADDVLKFSIDGKSTITVQLNNIASASDLFDTIFLAMENNIDYPDPNLYIYKDPDNYNYITFRNFEKNPNGNITFYRYNGTNNNNMALSKLFGDPADKRFDELYFPGYPLTSFDLTVAPDDLNADPRLHDALVLNYVFFDNKTNTRREPDFYLEYNETTKFIEMKKTTNSKIPDGGFYIHLINEREGEKDINNNPVIFDDGVLIEYLNKYKMIGISNKILKPIFSTFDIYIDIKYNRLFAPEVIEQKIKTLIKEKYSLIGRTFGDSIVKSKLISELNAIEGIDYVEIVYLGPDYTIPGTNVASKIDSDFDEITVINEDIFDPSGKKVHGLMTNYIGD